MSKSPSNATAPSRLAGTAALAIMAALAIAIPNAASAEPNPHANGAVMAAKLLQRYTTLQNTWEHINNADLALERCRNEVAAMRAAGIADDQEVEAGTNLLRAVIVRAVQVARTESRDFTTPGTVSRFCESHAGAIELMRARFAAEDSTRKINDFERGTYSTAQIEASQQVHRRCLATLKRALTVAPAAAAFEIREAGPKTIMLGQVELYCIRLGQAITKAQSIMLSRQEDDLEPFDEALAGDKLRVFTENLMLGRPVFTSGKRALATAADFAAASVWYHVLRDDGDYGQEVWLVRRYQFQGDRLEQMTESRGVKLRDPPDETFK